MPLTRSAWTLRVLVPLLSFVLPVADGCKKKAEEAPEVSVAVQAATSYPRADCGRDRGGRDPCAGDGGGAFASHQRAHQGGVCAARRACATRAVAGCAGRSSDLKGSALDSSGAVTSAQANYTATTQTTIPEEVRKAELDTTQLKAALDVAPRALQGSGRRCTSRGALRP